MKNVTATELEAAAKKLNEYRSFEARVNGARDTHLGPQALYKIARVVLSAPTAGGTVSLSSHNVLPEGSEAEQELIAGVQQLFLHAIMAHRAELRADLQALGVILD
jgi:hypothetical protein